MRPSPEVLTLTQEMELADGQRLRASVVIEHQVVDPSKGRKVGLGDRLLIDLWALVRSRVEPHALEDLLEEADLVAALEGELREEATGIAARHGSWLRSLEVDVEGVHATDPVAEVAQMRARAWERAAKNMDAGVGVHMRVISPK